MKFKVASSNPRVTSSNPRVMGSNPQVTCSTLRVTSSNSLVTISLVSRAMSSISRYTISNPGVTSSISRVTSWNPRVTSSYPRFTSWNSRIIELMKTQRNSFNEVSQDHKVNFFFTFLLLHSYGFIRLRKTLRKTWKKRPKFSTEKSPSSLWFLRNLLFPFLSI